MTVIGRTFRSKINRLLMTPIHFFPMGHRPAKLWYHPLKLDVEVTTRCNMACEFCYRKYLNNLPRRDLKPKVLEKILEIFPYSEMVDFVGLGEPLLNQHFLDEIAIAKEGGRKVRFVTNVTLIDSDIAEQIVSLGVDELFVSLDAIRSKTSEALGRKEPDRVISGIKRILNSKKKNLPKITVQTLILRENVQELGEIGKLVRRLGLKWSLLHPFCLSEEAARRFNVFSSGLENQVDEAIRLGGFEVSTRKTSPIRGRCYAPWNVTYINADGDVYACCFLGTLLSNRVEDWFLDSRIEVDPEEYLMGNVNGCKSIWRIWNSENYQELRRKLSKWQEGDQKQQLSVNEYRRFREEYDQNEKFSYCKICQDRFGVAC